MPLIPLPDLKWRPDSVAKILRDHGVRNRSELAKTLEPLGITRSAVYRAFDDFWCGRADDRVLPAMARVFSVPLNMLVNEPSQKTS